jgi:flagellar protein FlaI
MEEGTVQLNKIFQWNPERDTIDQIGITSNTLQQIATLSGKSIIELQNEIENRKIVLKHMIRQNIRSVEGVNGVIELYYKSPQKVLDRIVMNR